MAKKKKQFRTTGGAGYVPPSPDVEAQVRNILANDPERTKDILYRIISQGNSAEGTKYDRNAYDILRGVYDSFTNKPMDEDRYTGSWTWTEDGIKSNPERDWNLLFAKGNIKGQYEEIPKNELRGINQSNKYTSYYGNFVPKSHYDITDNYEPLLQYLANHNLGGQALEENGQGVVALPLSEQEYQQAVRDKYTVDNVGRFNVSIGKDPKGNPEVQFFDFGNFGREYGDTYGGDNAGLQGELLDTYGNPFILRQYVPINTLSKEQFNALPEDDKWNVEDMNNALLNIANANKVPVMQHDLDTDTYETVFLPEVEKVANKRAEGGALHPEWNSLSMRERAAYIRDAVSRGLNMVTDIRNDYNKFKDGGKKSTRQDAAKQTFLDLLEKALEGNSRYNTAGWRQFLTDLAKTESSYRGDITNNIGAKGYFQLMPSNRSASWSTPIQQFQEMFKLSDANMEYFRKNLTEKDLKLAQQKGIDLYGLMAGAHLGGAANAIAALRGTRNTKDNNGTSVLSYMTRFSQTNPRQSTLQDFFNDEYVELPDQNPRVVRTINPYLFQDEDNQPSINYQLLLGDQDNKENSTIDTEVPVQKQSYIQYTPDQILSQMNSMIVPYKPVELPKLTTATEILKQAEENRTSLLQKGLEDNIRSYIQKDLTFNDTFAEGGNLFSGEDEPTQQMQLGNPYWADQDMYLDWQNSTINGETLPEVTVTPTNDASWLFSMGKYINNSRKPLADSYTRKVVANYLSKFDAENAKDYNARITRLADAIFDTNGVIFQKNDVKEGKLKGRAHYNPNTGIAKIDSMDDIFSELAHPYQSWLGNNIKGDEISEEYDSDKDPRGGTRYAYPDTYEGETHGFFEPTLKEWVETGKIGRSLPILDKKLSKEKIVPKTRREVTDSAASWNRQAVDRRILANSKQLPITKRIKYSISNFPLLNKKKRALGGNLFDGTTESSQQMNNGLNLYRRTNNLGETEYIYQETPDSEEILLTPTNKRFSDDPTNWDYKDASGREYLPRMVKPAVAQAELKPYEKDWYHKMTEALGYDWLVNKSNEYYNNPILGAAARWAASYDNNTNPIKGLWNSPLAYGNIYSMAAKSADELLLNPNGLQKTIDLYNNSDGSYADRYAWQSSLLGDAFNASMILPAASKAAKSAYDGTAQAIENYRYPFGRPQIPEGYITIKPQVRTRVGDIEIDNPQLAYRQGEGIVDDFIRKGAVEAATPPESNIVTTREGLTFDFTPQSFDLPMFSQGRPWYGIGKPKSKEMLVTAEPLSKSNSNGGLEPWKYNGTFDVRYDLGKPHTPGWLRRVPDDEQVLNTSNTSAYRWEPGYGYRRVFAEETPTADWPVSRAVPQMPAENSVSINISPEELYKVLQEQEGYYFMGHGTGRTDVDPQVIFDSGLRIKNGEVSNTTSPISESNLALWPHADSKEIIILPARAENTMYDAAHGHIPADWYDSNTFQWSDNPGFEGSGFFRVQKPNATFVETEVNGVPGVYTKPSAILGSYNTDTHVLRLNPNSQYKFQFGETSVTPQITAENAASEMPNIVRTVQDNGKIRLSLPSHTDAKPRQLVLEPQGDNKYYVHTRTWDGDHIPANMSASEKQALYDALYEELPDGAEILLPKSGEGYYVTRGAVAELQRLARDPRFTPGTKGTLQYLDKDGKTVRTYEGTSFIKAPRITPENSASMTSGIMADANDFSYKGLTSDMSDFFEKMMYSNKIHGKPMFPSDEGIGGFSKGVQVGIPEAEYNELLHDVIGRNVREFRQAGLNDAQISNYIGNAKDAMDNVRIGMYSNSDYVKGGWEGFGGFYDSEGNFISVNTGSPLTKTKVVKHEGRHLLDHKVDDEILMPTSESFGKDFDSDKALSTMQKVKQNQNMILYDAYDNDFVTLPSKEGFNEGLEGYSNMDREAITTNLDSRNQLLGSKADWDLDVTDKIIDKTPDDAIFEAVEKANGYGRRYIRFLRENNKLTPEKAKQFREAMKHVGVAAFPVAAGVGLLFGQNNQ